MSVNFERKKLNSGEDNPKYVDLLTEDKPISGQKFVCVSFVSPENILVRKEHFLFAEFLKHYDFSKSIEKMTHFLHFLSIKNKMDFNVLSKDFEDFLKSEKDDFDNESISNDYKTFLDKYEDKLTEEFNSDNNFQTSTRGLKIRGSYETQQEAEIRAKLLREVDPNHNVFVGPVGMWMPWDPEAYKTGRVEYVEEELNQLMSEKNKNENYAKKQFEQRVKESKKTAIKDNIENAKKNKTKLTQNIDLAGNLVGVNNTIDNSFDSNTSSADIRKELFESENIATHKSGAQEALERFAKKKLEKIEEETEETEETQETDGVLETKRHD